MDFARKQLEKYGWTTGKGLGKHENGISEALKPKIKRSVTGIGHNAAEDFTEHWWTTLYNKAAENVEFDQKNGKTKKFKTKDENAFEITNSNWKFHRKQKNNQQNEEYQDFFVKTEILGNGGSEKLLNVKDSESDSDNEKKDVLKLTDEELFAACGGRTAHKGARFGLKATGKLARIKEQEEKLLDLDKYSGYSHAKNRKTKSNFQDGEDVNCNVKTTNCNTGISNCTEEKRNKKRKDKNIEDYQRIKLNSVEIDKTIAESNEVVSKCEGEKIKKKKKSKRKFCEHTESNRSEQGIIGDDTEIKTNKKKCKRKNKEKQLFIEDIQQTDVVKKAKKKKSKSVTD